MEQKTINTDFEVMSLDAAYNTQAEERHSWRDYLLYFFAGLLFGVILVKSEVISWFRIQEMFRLQSFHMYGVIGSAVLTGIISIQLIKRFRLKTFNGAPIFLPKKKFHKGIVWGGLLFGFGWAITGACPGPIFAQIGTGMLGVTLTLLSAIAGTWLYGLLRDKLPH